MLGRKGLFAQPVFSITVEVIVGVDRYKVFILAQVALVGACYPLVLVSVPPGIEQPVSINVSKTARVAPVIEIILLDGLFNILDIDFRSGEINPVLLACIRGDRDGRDDCHHRDRHQQFQQVETRLLEYACLPGSYATRPIKYMAVRHIATASLLWCFSIHF